MKAFFAGKPFHNPSRIAIHASLLPQPYKNTAPHMLSTAKPNIVLLEMPNITHDRYRQNSKPPLVLVVDTDYITKPIQPALLRKKVAKVAQQTDLIRRLEKKNEKLECRIQSYNILSREHTTQLQRCLALETTLKRITDRVRDSLDEAQIMQTVVNELASALDAVRCNAGLYSHNKQVSSIHYEHTTNSISYQNRVLQLDSFPEIYQQLLQGCSMQFCPIPVAFTPGQTAMFVFPILHGEQPIGDIWLVCKAHRTLDHLEVRLVNQVVNQCAIAIRQARLYQAAQAQVKELERLNQLKDDFLSTVSHELRSPMTSIRMAVQMLEQLATQVKERYGGTVFQKLNCGKCLNYLQIIRVESNREIDLINDLLDLQRLEIGDQPLDLTLIDFKEWTLRLIQPFLERTQQRQQNLQLHLAPDLPPIQSDAKNLNRILTELLHNACKYTPPKETITLSINFHPDLNVFQIRVTNTGVEISLKEQDHIFDKFYRIPGDDRWQQGGTGLGLALVRRTIESMGGSIQVNSAALQTCFLVSLPNTIHPTQP